jgi:hypothetical protein
LKSEIHSGIATRLLLIDIEYEKFDSVVEPYLSADPTQERMEKGLGAYYGAVLRHFTHYVRRPRAIGGFAR